MLKKDCIVNKSNLLKYKIFNLKKSTKIQISLIIALILSIFIYGIIDFYENCNKIKESTLRLHIKANSDIDFDQNLKLKVRDSILTNTKDIFNKFSNKQTSKEIVSNNINKIQEIAQQTVYNEGFDYKVSAKIENIYFNTRDYESFKMPAGYYDALSLDIGKGEGKNWWCVLFPPLCLPSSIKEDEHEVMSLGYDDKEKDIIENHQKYEFKFAFVEVIEKVKSWFK